MNGAHCHFYPCCLHRSALPCQSPGFRIILDTTSTELVTVGDNYQLSCPSCPPQGGKKKNHKTVKNGVKLPGFESWHLVFEARLCHLKPV